MGDREGSEGDGFGGDVGEASSCIAKGCAEGREAGVMDRRVRAGNWIVDADGEHEGFEGNAVVVVLSDAVFDRPKETERVRCCFIRRCKTE